MINDFVKPPFAPPAKCWVVEWRWSAGEVYAKSIVEGWRQSYVDYEGAVPLLDTFGCGWQRNYHGPLRLDPNDPLPLFVTERQYKKYKQLWDALAPVRAHLSAADLGFTAANLERDPSVLNLPLEQLYWCGHQGHQPGLYCPED